MQYSISRRALALAAAIVLPQVLLVSAFGAQPWARWVSLAAALSGISIVGLWSRSLARRIKNLTGFLVEVIGPPDQESDRIREPVAGSDQHASETEGGRRRTGRVGGFAIGYRAQIGRA